MIGDASDFGHVVIRPGDALVIAFDRPIDARQVEMIKERAATELPGVKVVIVDCCSGLAVCRD